MQRFSRIFKLVPSQLSGTNSPNMNHFRPPSSTNACNKCLFFFYHLCLQISIRVLNFTESLFYPKPSSTLEKKKWQGTSFLWVWTMDFVTSYSNFMMHNPAWSISYTCICQSWCTDVSCCLLAMIMHYTLYILHLVAASTVLFILSNLK